VAAVEEPQADRSKPDEINFSDVLEAKGLDDIKAIFLVPDPAEKILAIRHDQQTVGQPGWCCAHDCYSSDHYHTRRWNGGEPFARVLLTVFVIIRWAVDV
jgi:hypothetical protein